MSGVLGSVVVAFLVVALVFARPGWIGPVLGLFAALYLGHLLVAPGSNLVGAATVGLGLLLVGELSQWSFDSRLRGQYAGAVHRARAIGVTGLTLLGLATAFLILLAVGVPIPGGLATLAAGMGAAVALVVLISIVAVRPPPARPDREA